ncbi:hypothetical protein [Alteromonas oceanisediminis]|uniref:hypothetical protein n=1 Tax=Alteromonas oceanisediminis TaxID=2836180 RepID=UPI001BDB0E4E|nr:hypothetical protein [Alteromonas oceanisediminis]MBT0585196.1 hypothetical protein [Alteromonas oceanisediminis]
MQVEQPLNPNLQSPIDATLALQPSASQDHEMQQRLQARIAQHSVAEKNTGWHWGFPVWATAASLALVAVLSVGILLSSSVTAPAFASVVQSLSNISTMTYRGTIESNGAPLMRLEVFYRAPSNVRIENTPLVGEGAQNPIINILDVEQGKGVIVMPQGDMRMPFDFTPNKNVHATPDQDPLNWFHTVTQYQGDVAVLPTKTLDGVNVAGYEIQESGMTITLWVDTDSQLPVNVRVEMDESVQGQSPFILDADLTFNRTLSDELFDLT